ncbi:MAG: hypothetical protein NTU44_00170 [Bacteroidetes bacterium]|nr:hypothetical protein [Bacteroidota bacterium]
MKRIVKMLPEAMVCVRSCKISIVNEKGKEEVDSAFNGYISSMGASIITAGLLPTLIFFSNKGGSQSDRPAIIKAIEKILKNNLFLGPNEHLLEKVLRMVELNDNAGLAHLSTLISDAAVALKLAIRTFPEKTKD